MGIDGDENNLQANGDANGVVAQSCGCCTYTRELGGGKNLALSNSNFGIVGTASSWKLLFAIPV
jgi:hypothetical protein